MFRKLFQKTFLLPLLHKSIYDLPIRQYQRFYEEQHNYKHLYKFRLPYYFKVSWLAEDYEYQIIDEFGLGKKQLSLFNKRRELILAICDNYNGKRNNTQIEILKKEIEKLTSEVQKEANKHGSLKRINNANNRNLSKWNGRDLDNLTVYEYFADMHDAEKEAIKEKIKQQTKKKRGYR